MSNKRNSGVPKVGKSGYEPRSNSSVMTYVLGGLGVLVVAALIIGGVIWNNQRGGTGQVDETVLNQNSALIIGAADAPVTIDVFEDFSCPHCADFEATSGQAINDAIEKGDLRVRYHPLNFLDSRTASGDYSSRAAGALQCVAEQSNRTVFQAFHTALFEAQPTGGSDLSNEQIAQIAADNGADPGTRACIADGAKVEQAKESAQESANQLQKAIGQVGSPVVLSGGEPVDGIMNLLSLIHI